MILWINGPYGVGKSTLAEELCGKLPNAFLFDGEKVGDAVRDNYPPAFFKETYEEYPLWQETCRKLLQELASVYDGDVLVPMTLMRREAVEAIIGGLRADGVAVCHILLEADRETVRQRILARGEDEDCWCMGRIGPCQERQGRMPCDLRLNTTGRDAGAVADAVMEKLDAARL